MTREEMLHTLEVWIGEITERVPPALTFDTDLVRDLRLDSLALAELGSRLRVRYHVRLLPSELIDALRVGTMIDLVRERLDHPKG